MLWYRAMNSSSSPSPPQLRDWLAALDAREAEIAAALQPLLNEQSANRERRRLLADLVTSYEESCPIARPSNRSLGEPVGARIRRQVRRILDDEGSPMHINDIHAAFVERAYDIPGQGRPANITAHLTRDDEIISPQRGLYGLRSVVGPIRPKSVKRRKSSRRRE